jgi:uncharacterized protein (TIGR03382 family)
MRSAAVLAFATSVMSATLLVDTHVASACGCLSPPAVTEGDFAVNQQAEQIIFEVEPGWVTAHVLIRYAGDPAQFAWIVPVPEVPELGISSSSAFSIIDQQTAPDVTVSVEDVCPISEWYCAYHAQPSCPGLFNTQEDQAGYGLADAGASSDAFGAPPPVTVIDEQVVGEYETVTFRANEAAAAVKWLRDNGFVVNQTTSIYMESYVQQNMVFVAAKLVAGAGAKAIRPLKLRYRASYPMVPLILTAVAAQPNLTVTSYIYAHQPYHPLGHPIVTLDEERIARDTKGRMNYPMSLARQIDEAGGDAFAIEYSGPTQQPVIGSGAMCCGFDYDVCGAAYDGQCQCPGDAFDAPDCEGEPDLVAGFELLETLANKYTAVTRITTRVSAEEMTFDPQFSPDYDSTSMFGRLTLRGTQASLANCSGAILDHAKYIEIDAKQSCAATYCGLGGHCVVTTSGPACECNQGYVAQRFIDLDSEASVTCVPRTPPVDLRANGEQLPNACTPGLCGAGTCIDRNGVAVCECAEGAAAAAGAAASPICETIVFDSTSAGAEDFSDGLREIDVCAPAPPTCYDGGWLVKRTSPRPGVNCGGTEPPDRLTHPGPKPTCGGPFGLGCGCQSSTPPPATTLAVFALAGFGVLRRRRVARRR